MSYEQLDQAALIALLHERDAQIENLTAENQALHEFIKYSPGADAIFDTNMCYIAASDRYRAGYDISDKPYLGHNHYALFPEIPQRWKDVHARVLAGAIEREEADGFERPDGSITYNKWECRPWYTAAGEIGGMISYTSVVDRQVELQEQHDLLFRNLKENEARFKMVLENSQVVVFTQDTDLRYTWIHNPGWGIHPEEVIGKRDTDLYPPDNAHMLTTLKQHVLDTGERQRDQLYIYHNGHEKWVDAFFEPIWNQKGDVVGVRGVAVDITELTETKNRLQQVNQELEQFAYVASHDLQEPLRMVSSYMELLKKRYEGQLDERADQYIHFAVDGAQRMKTLINDLLAFSRLNTRENTMERTAFNDIVRQAQHVLQAMIEESGATIHVEPLPTLNADPRRLTQVFQNLLSNAIKYARPDVPPEIHIWAEQRDKAWVFAVQDNGIGLPGEYADRVFVIFQRLHTKQEYEGTGIGLAICKKIIEMHNGCIWYEPRDDHGTTFYLTLPVE